MRRAGEWNRTTVRESSRLLTRAPSERPEAFHQQAGAPEAMHGDPIVPGRDERRGIGRSRQHVHVVAELGQRAGLVPGIRADSAEAGFRRILEREQADLHRAFRNQ